ncbi:phospholipase D-like domain-containing protein [Streptomyces sp. NPDC013740]|uniref:phospholipase D-like domain-containing protein n=1 Tax=Streptomyces sp. NPDC013740 TaxID=3364867 RepID=UPI0036FAAD75
MTAAVVSMPLPASAADGTTSGTPALEAVFNNPLPKGTAGYDRTIENRLIELIGKAAPASSIRVSLYTLEDPQVVDALIGARDRGVDVQVLSEGCPWPAHDCKAPLPEAERLAQSLGNAPDGKPRVILCQKGCMQNKDINHDKFWLFSALTDGRRNVAVQSSHNLGATTAALADNIVISSDDAQIYQGYEQTWTTMRAKELTNAAYDLWPEVDADGTGDFSGHAGTVAGWRYPRAARSGEVVNDPVARSISALDCATGPEVHIAMASWDGRTEVDKAIAAKVDAPGAGGKRCAFRIVVAGAPEKATGLERDAQHPNRDVEVWSVSMNQLNGASGGLHSKYVLLSWDDAAGPHRVVHTGSINFNDAGLVSADETSLRITDPGTYDAFKANWDRLRTQNDLTANTLADLPFLYEYGDGTAKPFTFGTTEYRTFRDPKHSAVSPATALHRKTVKGDFDGDGVPDLAVLNDEGTSTAGKMALETFLGKPDGRYSAGTRSWTAASDWGWFSSMRLTSGDYNGDGRDDVAALYTYAGTGDSWAFFTFLANPDGTFSAPRRAYESLGGWGRTSQMQLVSGKFDSDQRDDIAVLYTYADGGLGLHTFTAKADGTLNASFRSWYVTNKGTDVWGWGNQTRIVSGDFDGDRRDDIGALYSYGDGGLGLHTFTSQANGAFNKPFGSWYVANKPEYWGSGDRMKLTTGDFDGDGRDDIASLYGYTSPEAMAVHVFGSRQDGGFNAPFRGWYGSSFPWAGIQLPPS